MISIFSPELGRILLDFLTRRWLMLGLNVVNYWLTAIVTFSLLTRSSDSLLDSVRFLFLMSPAFIQSLLGEETVPGSMRSLLALPVKAKSIWNTYWWLSFGFPAVVCTAISLWALVGVWLTGPRTHSLDWLLIWFLGMWWMQALAECCLSLLSFGGGITKNRSVDPIVTGALRVVQMSRILFLIPISLQWQVITLGVSCATVATALFGLVLTGQIIPKRVDRPDYFQKPVSSRRSSRRVIGPRGWMALIRSVVPGILSGIINLSWSGLMLFFYMKQFDMTGPLQAETVFLMGFLMSASSIGLASHPLRAIRELRQLPLGASRLTLVLMLPVCLPFLLWSLASAVIQLAFQNESFGLWFDNTLRLSTALAACLYVPAIALHTRANRWLVVGVCIGIAIPMLLILGVLGMILDSTIRHLVLLAYSSVTAYLWTRWEISSGRTAYQRPVTNADPIST